MVEEIRMFPRWFYKQGEAPKLCASEEEAAALGEGWSDEIPTTPQAAPPTQRTPPVTPAESEEGEEEEHEGSPRRRR